MSENNWNHFKILPQGHNNCQLSIVNCQFGEAAKFQFISVHLLDQMSECKYSVADSQEIATKKSRGLEQPFPPAGYLSDYTPPGRPSAAVTRIPRLSR